MDDTYWIKQEADKPAFEDLLWSRPETRHARGKLLIIGGNAFGFSAVGEAYRESAASGAGAIRVLLPEAIRKVVGTLLEHAEYGASNASGGFAQSSLGEWLDQSAWADGVLIAGDLGRNSETAIVFEKFLQKTATHVTLTKDAVDYYIPLAKTIRTPFNMTLVLSMGQLQKLGTAVGFDQPFKLGMTIVQLIDTLHRFTSTFGLEIVVKHYESIVVSADGKVSTTKLTDDREVWRVKTAAQAAVWRLQNPSRPFEALTTGVLGV